MAPPCHIDQREISRSGALWARYDSCDLLILHSKGKSTLIRHLRLTPVIAPGVDSQRRQFQHRFLTAKLYYFLLFGAIGSIGPFLNVFLQQQGLNGTQVGWLNSLPPLVALMVNPIWGSIADRWQIHRAVLAICALGTGLVSLLFLTANALWVFMVAILFLHFFRTPLLSLLDGTVMEQIKGSSETYGQQRMWGSVGFVLASLGLGYLLLTNDLSLVFLLHAALLILGCTFLSLCLPVQRTIQQVDVRAGMRVLLRGRGYVSFLAATMLLGFGMSSYINFMGLYMLAIGGNEAQIGSAWAVNAIVEIPIMYLGSRWLTSFGYSRAVLFGLLGYSLVWSLMGFVTSPLSLILLAGVCGICFAILWMAIVNFASESAPDGLGATAQALVGAAQGGLGWGIGAVTAGYLWDGVGHSSVFWAAGAAALLGALIFWLGNRH